MPLYKIADVITDIEPKFDYFKNNAKSYIYTGDEKPQIKLRLNSDFLKRKLAENPHMTMESLEAYYLSSLFSGKIIGFNAITLHSSAILYKDKAFLFSAKSGVGKSTHTRLWIEQFGNENITIINDDLPVIKNENEEFFVYGTPFDGGTCMNKNLKAPLGAVIFIERDENNSIKRLCKNEIFIRIYQNTKRFNIDKDSTEMMLSNIDKLILAKPFYLLKCNTDIASVAVCEKMLSDDGII